jgi:hypothetical protein
MEGVHAKISKVPYSFVYLPVDFWTKFICSVTPSSNVRTNRILRQFSCMVNTLRLHAVPHGSTPGFPFLAETVQPPVPSTGSIHMVFSTTFRLIATHNFGSWRSILLHPMEEI